MAVDEAARSDPPHRGGDRGHQHAGFEGRQPRDGFQPFGDDVLVGREEIVGQCLPVRESQDSDVVVEEELELRFEPVRGPVVRGDDQHRRVRPPGEARDGEAAGAAVQRGPRRARPLPGHLGRRRGCWLRGHASFREAFAAGFRHGPSGSMDCSGHTAPRRAEGRAGAVCGSPVADGGRRAWQRQGRRRTTQDDAGRRRTTRGGAGRRGAARGGAGRRPLVFRSGYDVPGGPARIESIKPAGAARYGPEATSSEPASGHRDLFVPGRAVVVTPAGGRPSRRSSRGGTP